MKRIFMIDTNTFSYIVTGKSQRARAEFRKVAGDANDQLSISVITEAEVRFGMNKRALSQDRRDAIEALFTSLEIVPWGSHEAAIYGQALPQLQARGIGVSSLDFLIGVHAAATGAVLVTHDAILPRIAKITGIHTIIDWAKDI